MGLLFGLGFGFLGTAITGIKAAFGWFYLFGNHLYNYFFAEKPKNSVPSLQDFQLHTSQYGIPMTYPFGDIRTADNVFTPVKIKRIPIKITIKKPGLFTTESDSMTVGWKYLASWGSSVSDVPTNGIGAIIKVWLDNELWYDVSDEATDQMKADSAKRLKENGGTMTFHLGGETQTIPKWYFDLAGNHIPAHIDNCWIEFEEHEISGAIPKVEALVSTNAETKGQYWSKWEFPLFIQPRFSHASTVVPKESGDTLYIHGGLHEATEENPDGKNNNLLKFDFKNSWQVINNNAGKRDSHTLTHYIDNTGKDWLIIAGGIDENGTILTDIMRFDVSNEGNWQSIPVSEGEPWPRHGHAMSFIAFDNGTKGLIMTCGEGPGGHKYDIWESGNFGASWTDVNVDNDSGLGTRENHFQVVFNGEIYAGGGTVYSGSHDGALPTKYARALYKFDNSPGVRKFLQVPITVNGIAWTDNLFPHSSEDADIGINEGAEEHAIHGATVWGNSLVVFGRNKTASKVKIFLSNDGINFTEISSQFSPGIEGYESGSVTADIIQATFDSINNRMIVTGGAKTDFVTPVNLTRVSNGPLSISGKITLKAVIDDIVRKSKFAEQEFDTEELDSDELIDQVLGYGLKQQSYAENAIAPLQLGYFFDIVQDDKLRFLKRGQKYRQVITDLITADDLGAFEITGSNQSRNTKSLELSIQEENTLPKEVKINYFDSNKGHEVNTQTITRDNVRSNNIQNIDLPIVFSPNEAKRISFITMDNFWSERNPGKVTLGSKALQILPCDILQIPYQNESHIFRIIEGNIGANLICQISGASEDVTIYEGTHVGDPGASTINPDTGSMIVTPDVDVIGYIIDIPAIRQSQLHPGVFVFLTADSTNPEDFQAAAVWIKRSMFSAYQYFMSVASSSPSIIGDCDGILGSAAWNIWDSGSLQITLVNGTLESKTEAEVYNGFNLAYVGNLTDRHELIYFKNAVNTNGQTWVIDTFLRGMFGTQDAIPYHQAGEKFILLQTFSFASLEEIDIDRPIEYKIIRPGQDLDDVSAQTFTWVGLNMKPYAPVHITGKRFPDGKWRIEWIPTIKGGIKDFNNVRPKINEVEELYEIDFYTEEGMVSHTEEILVVSRMDDSKPYFEFDPNNLNAEQSGLAYYVGRDHIRIAIYQITRDPPDPGRGKPGFADIYAGG